MADNEYKIENGGLPLDMVTICASKNIDKNNQGLYS